VERFRRWLRDRGHPITAQRDLVAQVVLGSDVQASADDIARRLHEKGAHVGLATIYRALEVMVDAGFARAHDFGEGFKRYEKVRPGLQHGHLVCIRCAGVTTFSTERLDRVLPLIADEHEFMAQYHRVEIHGLCRACRLAEYGAVTRAARRR
jgi:Fur family ferric uptake transcriptional regulator